MQHHFCPLAEFGGTGFVRFAVSGRIEWLPGHDKDLFEYVENQGRPFLLVARNSTASGSAGYMAAANDAHEAADALEAVGGMVIKHLLPGPKKLAHMLRTGSRMEVHETPDGKRFVNRFVLVELEGTGIILSVSTGTGAMVSADLEQPHTTTLERYAREFTPVIAGMWAKRTDRYCRTVHGHTRLYDRLAYLHKGHGMWAGDGMAGRWDFDSAHTPMLLAVLASFGATESKVMRSKSQASQLGHTGHEMVDGRVAIGTPMHAPAGTMRYLDEETGRTVLSIDTPALYPPANKASKLPQVVGRSGAPADQVALHMRLFAEWGVDDTDPTDLFEELAAEGLSSHALRARYGLSCHYLHESHKTTAGLSTISSHWVRGIRNNLEFYKTGVLRVELGGVVHEITGCFPPGGKWAEDADWARIEAYESRREQKLLQRSGPRHAKSGWFGLEVTIDGVEASLRGRDDSTKAPEAREPGLAWNIAAAGHQPGSRYQFVSEDALNSSIVEALRAADGTVLDAYPVHLALKRAAGLREGRDEISQRLSEIDAQRKTMVDLLLSSVELSEQMSAEIQRRDATLVVEETKLLAQRRLVDIDLAVARQHVGAGASDMSKILDVLRGTYVSGARDALKRAVQGLQFTSGESDTCIRPVSWTGLLVIDDERTERGLWKIPFSGSFDPRKRDVDLGKVGMVTALRAGEVLRGPAGRLSELKRELAAHAFTPRPVVTRYDLRQVKSLNCNEPQLVRLWTALEFPDPVPGEDPGAVLLPEDLLDDDTFTSTFGGREPAALLVQRVRALHEEDHSGGWLGLDSGGEVEAILRDLDIEAGVLPRRRPSGYDYVRQVAKLTSHIKSKGRSHRWRYELGHWPQFVPCSFCGNRRCFPVRLREVTGYLCLDPGCRRDELGVVWPDEFNAYLCNVIMLHARGFDLGLPADFDGSRRRLNRRTIKRARELVSVPRNIEDLTEAERSDFVNSYLCGEMTSKLYGRLSLRRESGVAYLRAQGVALRNKRKKRPDVT